MSLCPSGWYQILVWPMDYRRSRSAAFRSLLVLSLKTSLLLMCATRQVSYYMRCRTRINVTTVTTTWTNIKSSPNIITGGGSAILSIPCDRESCDHARDQQRVVIPGGFRRTRPPLPDLKFIRSIFSYVNTARLNRVGKSDTLPDMVIRHKLM